MSKQGTVKWYNSEKGYGFITPDDVRPGERDMFVHASAVTKSLAPSGTGNLRNLEEGQRVSFDIGTNRDKPCAVNIRVLA